MAINEWNARYHAELAVAIKTNNRVPNLKLKYFKITAFKLFESISAIADKIIKTKIFSVLMVSINYIYIIEANYLIFLF